MLKPIHVCILTTAHPIDDVRVNYKFARAFHAAGFRVSWVGPNHAFFDLKYFNADDIEFILGPPIRTRIDRLLTHRRIRAIAERLSKVDVFYSPDPDAAQIAISLGKKNDAKVIFDIHEIYHGALIDRWLLGYRVDFIRELMRKWIARIASKCNLIVGVSDSVLAPYVTTEVPKMVVRSCAPSWFCTKKIDDIYSEQRTTFTVMHGKSDLGRGTLQAVEAAALSYKQVGNLRIVMFESVKNIKDDNTHPLISRIKELGVNEIIDIRPSVPMQDMPGILQRCDAGLILYNRALGQDSLPNRIFEYMASGLAIIAPIYAKEIARIIESEQCGLLVDCEDPADIAKAIIQLSRNPQLCREMGRRSRDAFLARHNWETEVRPVIDCIQKWQTYNLK
jgi:glycosyltransferase involved in cell wall biosynthesis